MDDILYYLWYKPKSMYSSIRHWFRVCGRFKDYWKFIYNSIFKNYPWDSYYFMLTQYFWLKRSVAYFEKFGMAEDNNETIRWQKICIGLLEIILEKREIYEFENHKVKMLVPINMKNKERFPIRGTDYNGKTIYITELYDKFPSELYIAKAKYLYYKILSIYSDDWWD